MGGSRSYRTAGYGCSGQPYRCYAGFRQCYGRSGQCPDLLVSADCLQWTMALHTLGDVAAVLIVFAVFPLWNHINEIAIRREFVRESRGVLFVKLNHYPKFIVAGALLGATVLLLPTVGEARHMGASPDLETKVETQRTINIGESRTVDRQADRTHTLEARIDAILHPVAADPVEQRPAMPSVPATVSAYDNSIIGTPLASQQQCVNYLLSVNPTPNISVTPQELVAYYYEEGTREGIRPDVAFAQALKETGFFRYGGTVTPDQNNYCGLGTTSSQVKGAYFDSAKLGVRAQIQHLLAYASTRTPAEPVVDPRYSLVRSSYGAQTLGTWDDLNGRWAVPGYSYGQSIMSIFRAMLMK